MRKRLKFSQHKERAMVLRREGKTYAEIRNQLGVFIPKSTLSLWCCNVEMPIWYQEKVNKLNRANLSKALTIAHASNELKRERRKVELQACNKETMANITFNKDVYKALLAILYLGEGTKASSNGLSLGSTDPNIIRMYIAMLGICYKVPINDLKCRISHRADQNLRVLQEYWSDLTGIPMENFYKSIPDPRTVGKPTKRLDYKGVCIIYAGRVAAQLEIMMLSGLILESAERAYSSAVEQFDGIE